MQRTGASFRDRNGNASERRASEYANELMARNVPPLMFIHRETGIRVS